MKAMVTLGIMVILVLGCGNQHKKKKTNTAENQAQVVLEVTQQETIDIVRKEKMTYRYDCNKHITSAKAETVNSLKHSLKLSYDRTLPVSYIELKNDRDDAFLNPRRSKNGKFDVDYSPTPLRMRVKKGLNRIHYRIFSCKQFDAYKNCVEQEQIKEAIFEVTVNYSSELVPGERHYYQRESACQNQTSNS